MDKNTKNKKVSNLSIVNYNKKHSKKQNSIKRNKKKRNSKLSKILRLIFKSIYLILIRFKLIGPHSNKFVTTGICILLVIISVILSYKNSYEILVGGVPVSTIRMSNNITQDEFEVAAIAKLEGQVGTKILLNEEITFRPVNSIRRNINTVDQALSNTTNALTYKIEGGLFVIDEEEVVIVSSVDEANEIYQELIEPFIDDYENVVSTGFIEELEIIPRFIEYEEVYSKDVAINRLTATTQEIQTYEVAQGDTLWGIANRVGMTLDELLEYNQGMTTNTPINIGDNITVAISIPRLNVVTVEKLVLTESIPYQTQTTFNDNQARGVSRVIKPGINGELIRTYHITKVNGFETERTLVNTETVEPVDEEVEIGTQV